jgi:xanthine/uracil permease
MPFYSCLAYSLGAAFARKAFGYADSKSSGHFRAVTVAGFIVVAAFLIDLIISVRDGGWHGTYLLLALTPTVVGALLLYVGLTMRPQPASTA